MTTTNHTITERLRGFIVAELGWTGAAGELTDDYPLIDNDVLDSLGIFQVVTFLEEDLGVTVADEDLVPANFATIGAITRLASRRA